MKNQTIHRQTSPPLFIADFGACIFLCIATLWVFSNVTHFEFVYFDDPEYITQNYRLFTGINFKSLKWAFTTTLGNNWHPLTWLTHLFDYQLYGLDAGGHHLTNLFLHLANTLLLYFFIRKISADTYKSILIAGLFALHPLHVESVAWVSERKDVLSTFFWISALLAYLYYVKKPGWPRYLIIMICLVFSLLAKPMAVTLPLILLLLDFWPLMRFKIDQNPSFRQVISANLKLFLEKIPLFIPILPVILIIIQIENVQPLEIYPFSDRVANAILSYLIYIEKFIWPAKLAFFYPYPQDLPIRKIAASSIAMILGLLLSLRFKTRFPFLFVGFFWYFVTMLPVIGLVQVGAQSMADRYTYIPHIGLYLMVSYGIFSFFERFPNGKHAALALSIVWLVLLARSAIIQTGYWENSFTLFRHAIHVTPNNYVAHNNLGLVLHAQERWQEAEHHYQQALNIKPAYPEALNNLGVIADKRGDTRQAYHWFKRTLKINGNHFKARNNLAALLLKTGKIDEAIHAYQAILESKPDYAKAHSNLGAAFYLKQDPYTAGTHYQRALELDPNDAKIQMNYGIILRSQNKPSEAQTQFTKAIQLDPSNSIAYLYLGDILLIAGKVDEAASALKRSVQINARNAQAQYRLGDALLRKGDISTAISHYENGFVIEPKYSPALDFLVREYKRRREYEKVIELYARLIERHPRYRAELYYQIADMYARNRLKTDAGTWLKKAVENGYNKWDVIQNNSALNDIQIYP